jgi:two-component system NarL family response regulator
VESVETESRARADGRIRVVVVDSRAPSRRALAALLDTYTDMLVVGEATGVVEALDLVDRVQPDVAVVDVYLPRLDGLPATALIKQRFPRVGVFALSLSADAAHRALAVGADAFVVKGDPQDLLLETIRGLRPPG